MRNASWLIDLDQVHSSYLVLIAIATIALAACLLFYFGLLRLLDRAVGVAIQTGFILWERLLSWASWQVYGAVVVAFLIVGGVTG